jgi:methanogenic corrinoid protein MtbC1
MTDRPTIRAALDEAFSSYDRSQAVEVAVAAVADGSITIEDLYSLLSSKLVDIGAAWGRGSAEVWQEHFATSVARTIVESCALRVEHTAPPERTATVVLAAPSNEYHDLGLRMLTDRFILAGWRAQFLGANLPVSELITAVEALGAHAVALSASTHYHRVGLLHYVEQLSASHPGVRVWVGGPAFAHEHDGWPDGMMLDPHAIPDPSGH